MCKKGILFGALGLAGLTAVFVGTEAGSYCKMAGREVKEMARHAVPVSVEIERARQMVEDLRPEIKRNMYVIAREEVEIKNLESQIARHETRLEKQRSELASLRDAAASGKATFQFASRTYSAEQVKRDLHNRLTNCKNTESTLNEWHELRDAKQQTLDAARAKLDNALLMRTQLKAKIENLQAKLQRIEAEQTASEYAIDDTQLGRLKALVHDIEARLDVEERMVNAEGAIEGVIPVSEEETPADIVDQVTSYLDRDASPAGAQFAQAPSSVDVIEQH